jgi:adenine-specific DNA-methyltransferase
MTISFISLVESINKAYRLIKPRREDLDIFKANFTKLLGHIDEKETEENVKGHLADFLKSTYYDPNHLIATKGRADLVIHLEKEAKSHVGVLFEVKKPSNKLDMVTKDNLNTKAMHELILYFLRERVNHKNISLTHLVITNIYEWFVFDASLFERVFAKNTQLQKAYKEWEAGQKVSVKTELFYNEIAKPFLHELQEELIFTHVDIREYLKYLQGSKEKDDNKLIPLYKFFSPVNLLKLPFINDSNSLDTGFFKELLHIIGLEEVKDGSRKIIQRLPLGKRQPASLIENTINMLEVDDVLRKVPSKFLNGKTSDEQLFNLGLELSITWVNRILFLKLLEAQLIKYHNGNTRFRFLNVQTVNDYDELHKLFFQVLARQSDNRTSAIQQKYSHIPYLNSSLFEISPLEDVSLRINGLDDNLDIDLYNNSILTKKRARNQNLKAMNTLHYFFEFLEAYDFSSIGKEEVQEENKTIINAAVLGLVFEKMNGYRDGSIYTPGAVTMFLCEETIRKAVVQKFNKAYGWQCEDIGDVKNYLADKKNRKDILEYNLLIESIRIVDPAVGSGHFLVSSLNELIVIKAQLGILADKEGGRLSDIDVSIANDELVVTYRNSSFFEYSVSTTISGGHVIAPEIQRIQETLFNEKRKLIEGSLFGVDINSNSVKICQLRLWIELLKHAYYKADENYTQLETLPNIDINIKHGNSLLNKYSLTEDLSEVFKKQKFGVKDYRLAVEAYKDAPNKDAKAGLQNFIKTIKEQFHETVSNRDPRRKRLSELRGQLALAQNNFDLFGKTRSEKEMEVEVQKIILSMEKIDKEISDIQNNAIYRNAFEWRFEFPEVLNEKGDFEGFEVIIGNPPYIQLQKMGEDADALQKGGYSTFTRTGDIYCLFYEQAIRLLKPDYYFGFITSNKWMRANYGIATRKFFLEKTNPLLLVDFGGYQVFESATVDTNMLISQKAAYSGETRTCLLDKSLGSLEKMSVFIRQSVTTQGGFKPDSGWVILSPLEATIKNKIEAVGTPLKDWDINIYRGILTGYNDAFIIDQKTRDTLIEASPKNDEIIRPIIRGRDIKSYTIKHENKWVIFTRRGIDIELFPSIKDHLLQYYEDLKPRKDNDTSGRKPGPYKWYEIQDNVAYYKDFDKEKIIWIELTDKPNFALDTNGYYINNTIFFITGSKLKYLLAFLNSRLCEWYFDKIAATSGVGTRRWIKIYIDQICVPFPDEVYESRINSMVDLLNKNYDTKLIKELDTEIYNMFELSPNEIELITNASL